ncbi:ThuA domain-containing protein [Actinospongicola halichondriae]|uniref:ThuA domain-containing protein n=1 Tax=Actinospongicola halichondriae TaxID=3236844 RepID=UPI003D389E84
MSEVLLLTGGRGHPAEATAATLTQAFGDLGLGVDATDDVEGGLERLDAGRHVLLAVNALQFTMTDPRYDEVREAEAFTLSPAGRSSIEAWHAGGGPILAIHTALLCFDDWPGWASIVGGRWDWSRSSHPPIGTVEVQAGDHDFTVVDECYQDLDIDPGVEVVAASAGGHPLAWFRPRFRDQGSGAVAVDLLGHDHRSLDHPGHRRLLRGLVERLRETDS